MRIWRDGPRVPAKASISRSVRRRRRLAARLLLAFSLACALVGDLAANRRRPYLPAVGPIPVRFEVAQLPTIAKFTLPPLDMGVPTQGAVEMATTPPPVPAPAEPAPAVPATVELPAPGNPANGQLPPLPGPALTATPSEPAPEPALVQPTIPEAEAVLTSRLMDYFRAAPAGNAITGVFGRTNSTWIGVLPSVGFQPPAPANSSSATYSVSRPASK